jgi:hypothetical protein
MKRLSVTLAALTLVALGCDASAPTTPPNSMSGPGGPLFAGGGNGVVHRASVGGHDMDQAENTDANFSLVAIEHGDGRITGQWTDQFGQGEGGIHVEVNCLLVLGNNAWVSGIVKSGSFGGVDFTGQPAITRVADFGKSHNDPPDAISFSFVGVAVPCTAAPPLPLLPMTDGQVKVE